MDNIKVKRPKGKTHILLEELLPTSEELQELKDLIVKKYKLHRNDKLTYPFFQEIYDKYGGVMPEDMFAREIFDISKKFFVKLSKGEIQDTDILIHTFMTPDEIIALREQVIMENNVTPGSEISMKTFEDLYTNYEHTLSRNSFAKHILKVVGTLKSDDENDEKVLKIYEKKQLSQEDIQAIQEYLIQEVDINKIAITLDVSVEWLNKKIEELYQENIISAQEIRKQKVMRLYKSGNSPVKISHRLDIPLEDVKNMINEELGNSETVIQVKDITKRKATAILDEYIYSPKNVAKIKKYVKTQKSEFDNTGIFPKSDLDFIKECIEFAQGGEEEIEFFVRLCISFQEYQKANDFINENIDNEGIQKDEKVKIRQLQKSIQYAIKKEKAVYMIFDDNMSDYKKIAESTGLSEADVLNIRNQGRPKKSSKEETYIA